jgi:NAD(P)-dependent dehydrogenase (short-subunit alcohol dehydrogenase family)
VEALTRNLSAEFAGQGIRVVGLRPQGMPDSGTIKEIFGLHAKAWGISWDQFRDLIASRTHGRRLTTLEEMANTAVFAASDAASGITGTTINPSLGSLND